MQGKMKYMNVQQQQYTALRFVVFTPLSTLLNVCICWPFLFYTHIYICIWITAYVYIYMMGICSVVFSELLFFDAGEFRTENLSLGEFNFFFSSGENKPSLRYSNPSSNDLERGQRRREGRWDKASQNKTHNYILRCHTHIYQFRSKVWRDTGNLQPQPSPLALRLSSRVFLQKKPSNPQL